MEEIQWVAGHENMTWDGTVVRLCFIVTPEGTGVMNQFEVMV